MPARKTHVGSRAESVKGVLACFRLLMDLHGLHGTTVFFFQLQQLHRCLLKRRHPSNDQQGSCLQVLSGCVDSFGSRTSQHCRTAGCSFYQKLKVLRSTAVILSPATGANAAALLDHRSYLLGKKHEIRCVRRNIDSKDI